MRLSKNVIETLGTEYESIQRQIHEKEREAARLRAEVDDLRETAASLKQILGKDNLPDTASGGALSDGPSLADLEATSFRDALKRILSDAGRPVPAREVTAWLKKVGYTFTAKTEPSQLVNNNLSAMAKRGDLVRTPEGYMLARES